MVYTKVLPITLQSLKELALKVPLSHHQAATDTMQSKECSLSLLLRAYHLMWKYVYIQRNKRRQWNIHVTSAGCGNKPGMVAYAVLQRWRPVWVTWNPVSKPKTIHPNYSNKKGKYLYAKRGVRYSKKERGGWWRWCRNWQAQSMMMQAYENVMEKPISFMWIKIKTNS